MSNLSASVVNIKGIIDKIKINIPAGVTVKGVSINNQLKINKYRILYIAAILNLLLILYVFRKELSHRPEVIFLLICLTIGGLFILVAPTRFISWDEHIHFYRTFDWFEKGEVNWSQAEYYQYHYHEKEDNMPFLSKEEKAMQIQYLNLSDGYNVDQYEKSFFQLSSIGYFHMAIVIKICKLLGVSFYSTLLFGKLANLFLYSILIAFAIKIVPYLKRTLMVLCLMPTPILLAVSYSYDVFVNGFLILGIALLLREYYYADKQMKVKDGTLMLLCFIMGSCPKAVYIPLILSFLFLPASKFKNSKSQLIWKCVAMISFVLLMMSFVVPSVGDNMEGDLRGGNTSVTQQMQLILHHPIAYIKVFLRNFYNTFDDFVLGRSSLAHMAYVGHHKMYTSVTVIMVAVFFTEPRVVLPQKSKNSLRNFKIVMIFLVTGVIGLIWTALYLSFTEIGMETIAGVQARYYIPLLLPVLSMLYSDKIKTGWKEEKYNFIISFCIIVLWNVTLYSDFLITYCN